MKVDDLRGKFSEHLFFLDNGVFRRFTNKNTPDKEIKRFWHHDLFLTNGQSSGFRRFFHPSLFLEYIGKSGKEQLPILSKKSILKKAKNELRKNDAPLVDMILEIAQKKLSSETDERRILSVESLNKKRAEQREFTHLLSTKFYEDLVLIIDDGLLENIKFYLALDFTMKCHGGVGGLNKRQRGWWQVNHYGRILSWFYYFDKQKINISMTRLYSKMLENIEETDETGEEIKKWIQEKGPNFKNDVKTFEDMADCDLTQFVCHGAFDSEGNKRPVVAVTFDNEEEIKKRVSFFQKIFFLINERFKPVLKKELEDSEASKKICQKQGAIAFVCQNSGKIKNLVDTKFLK